jgi:hypothetical protein
MFLFFIIAVMSFLVQLYFPWWTMAIAAFGGAFLFGKKAAQTFATGLLACGVVWLVMALYIHFTRGDLMTDRIAVLLKLPASWILYPVSFFIAGIVGGLAAVSGYYLKTIVSDRKNVGS